MCATRSSTLASTIVRGTHAGGATNMRLAWKTALDKGHEDGCPFTSFGLWRSFNRIADQWKPKSVSQKKKFMTTHLHREHHADPLSFQTDCMSVLGARMYGVKGFAQVSDPFCLGELGQGYEMQCPCGSIDYRRSGKGSSQSNSKKSVNQCVLCVVCCVLCVVCCVAVCCGVVMCRGVLWCAVVWCT